MIRALALLLLLGSCEYDMTRIDETLPRTDIRWGNRVLIGDPQAIPNARFKWTLVQTTHFREPIPIALQFRFQTAVGGAPLTPNQNFSPVTAVALTFTIRRGLDTLGGATVEQFTGTLLNLPKIVLAHSLGIEVELAGPLVGELFVECIATPVCCIDAEMLTGALSGDLGGFAQATITRAASNSVGPAGVFMVADPTRRQFTIVNKATTNLFVAFGTTLVDLTAGAEKYTLFLPPQATYESPVGGFTGQVTGLWDVTDPAGEALITEMRGP